MEESVEVHPPSPDRFLVTFCMDESREYTPFALLGDLVLDLLHSSESESTVGEP